MRGFTIKEMVIVLVIITLLCGASIPAYYHLIGQKRQADVKILIDKLQNKLKTGDLSHFPLTLDKAPSSSLCENCFSSLIENGVNNKYLYKISDTEYFFSKYGCFESKSIFETKGNYRITYDAKNGAITLKEIL